MSEANDASSPALKKRKSPEDLRSHRWFGVHDLRAMGHRSRAKQMGFDEGDFAGQARSLRC